MNWLDAPLGLSSPKSKSGGIGRASARHGASEMPPFMATSSCSIKSAISLAEGRSSGLKVHAICTALIMARCAGCLLSRNRLGNLEWVPLEYSLKTCSFVRPSMTHKLVNT